MKQYPYFQHLAQLMTLIELCKYFVPKVNILKPTNKGERDEWLKDSNGGWIDAMFFLPKGPFIMKIIPNLSLICSLLFFTHTALRNTVLCWSSMPLHFTNRYHHNNRVGRFQIGTTTRMEEIGPVATGILGGIFPSGNL